MKCFFVVTFCVLVGLSGVAWLIRPRLSREGAIPLVWVSGEHLLLAAGAFPTTWLALGYALWRVGPLAQTADVLGTAGLTFLIALLAGLSPTREGPPAPSY